VVRDPSIHKEVLLDVLQFLVDQGFQINGLIRSPSSDLKATSNFSCGLLIKSVFTFLINGKTSPS